MAKTRVELSSFITAWENSANVEEVAEKTGLKVMSVTVRANTLRNVHNIPLKVMSRKNGSRVNVNSAKELLATLRNTTVEVVNAESAALVAKRTEKEDKAPEKTA